MQKQLKLSFVSLGCPKNTVDSEVMLAKLAQKGFVITPEFEDADVVVINTCGFISPAKNEALDELTYAAQFRQDNSIKLLVAAGCLVEREKEQILKEVPEIDCLIGLADRDNIADIICKALEEKSYFTNVPEDKLFVSEDKDRFLITSPGSAYLRISDGCGRKCAFCTIPAIRGPFRSKPLDKAIEEAKILFDAGIKEINIIAQDSNFYGHDLGMKDGLNTLLKELDKIDFTWIRVLYLYPSTISDELIETISESNKIVNYIDMPVQHINNDILKSMRRTDTRENTMGLIEKLRAKLDDVVLRTTIITGYPGETEEQHRELLDFVKWAKFDALGCFTYFPEEGTHAATLPNQVAEDVKERRQEEIMLAQQEIAFDANKKLIGKRFRVLTGDYNGKETEARHYGQAPDIDSVCLIAGKPIEAGEFLRVEITGTRDYDLLCKRIRN